MDVTKIEFIQKCTKVSGKYWTHYLKTKSLNLYTDLAFPKFNQTKPKLVVLQTQSEEPSNLPVFFKISIQDSKTVILSMIR